MLLSVDSVRILLACRFASGTVQYLVQCKTVKRLLLAPTGANRHLYNRIVLRGNRMAAYMRQDSAFERIGLLGAGGFGRVELVKSKANNKYYALKTVLADQRSAAARFHTLAMVERDCAVVLNSEHFVKLKAAWIETSPESGDCYKFLWENMHFGDLNRIIEQLHPMTTLELRFKPAVYDKAFFSFHDGTFRSMLQGSRFADKFRVQSDALACLYVESQIIEQGGKQREYTHIIFLFLSQLLEGIRFLHAHNITHRDLKPANVLVGRNLRLRIADLGLASNFDVMHIPSMNAWSSQEWIVFKPEEHRIALGGAKEHARFYSNYLRQLGGLRSVGTKPWMAPEFDQSFYSVSTHKELCFNPLAYRGGDYYSLGVITFQLLTGLHPIRHALQIFGSLTFSHLRRLSHVDKMQKIKNLPTAYNPLLRRWMSVEPEDFELLFVDMRLHSVCLSLMEPDPRKRPDYFQLMHHKGYKSLLEEPFLFQPQPFHWNCFLRDRREAPFPKLLAKFAAEGAPPPPAMERGQGVPNLPGFPLVTFSPGDIGSPSEQPRPGPHTPPEQPRPGPHTPPDFRVAATAPKSPSGSEGAV